jgi:hypothetical protein
MSNAIVLACKCHDGRAKELLQDSMAYYTIQRHAGGGPTKTPNCQRRWKNADCDHPHITRANRTSCIGKTFLSFQYRRDRPFTSGIGTAKDKSTIQRKIQHATCLMIESREIDLAKYGSRFSIRGHVQIHGPE